MCRANKRVIRKDVQLLTEKEYVKFHFMKVVKKNFGEVPTQEEFFKIIPRYYVRKNFGKYNNLVVECGYKPTKDGVGRKPKEEK